MNQTFRRTEILIPQGVDMENGASSPATSSPPSRNIGLRASASAPVCRARCTSCSRRLTSPSATL